MQVREALPEPLCAALRAVEFAAFDMSGQSAVFCGAVQQTEPDVAGQSAARQTEMDAAGQSAARRDMSLVAA